MRPQSLGWARRREPVSRCRALRLLNGGGLHQRSEVALDCLFLGVGRLEEAAQKHRRSNDVLAGVSELRGIILLRQDVLMNLAGASTSTACQVASMQTSVLRQWR